MTNLIEWTRAAAGNGNAAPLLQRIAYWMPKATIRFGGELWIAKSAADWCAETGLSPKQYKTAIARLRQLRLVVTEQHIFGGKNVTHVRLTARGQAVVRGEKVEPLVPPTEAHTGPATEAPAGPSEWSRMGPPITRRYLKEIHQGATTGVQSHAIASCRSKQLPGETLKPERISEPQSSPGILKIPIPENSNESDSENPNEGNTHVQPQHPGSVRAVRQKTTAVLHKPDSVAGLEAAWKKIHGEVHGGFVAAFTTKQRGQLKHFIKACPDGMAAAVLETCLRHWLSFTEAAEAEAGIKSSPDKPNVGFLLKHVGTAVNEHLRATKASKTLVKQPVKPGMAKPAVQSTAGPPDPHAEFDEATYEPATKAEVMAMLGIEPPPPDTAVDPGKKGNPDES